MHKKSGIVQKYKPLFYFAVVFSISPNKQGYLGHVAYTKPLLF